ncbi:MAG TPA: DUF58 domain-containing protein, partial [Solirubrobacteraceae bacterium]|nr:DUF58 domain-containing protein [Solirubrobacteraceae bacterium]
MREPDAAPPTGDDAQRARVGSVVLLAALLLLTAVLFDAEPLYVPGLALLLLAAAALVWVRLSARGLRVRRGLSARRITENEPVAVALDVRAGRLPLPAGRVLDPLLAQPLALPAGRAAARLRAEVRFPRRGRRRLAPARVELADPLGVAARTAIAPTTGDDEVLVLPAVLPVRAAGAAGEGRPTLGVRVGAGPETELDGVATLREGTPASRIFWPAIARGAEPMERRMVAEDDPRPLVLLDAGEQPTDENLDAAVRAVASLAVALARGAGCAVLLPGDRRPADLDAALRRWPALHARLAVV